MHSLQRKSVRETGNPKTVRWCLRCFRGPFQFGHHLERSGTCTAVRETGNLKTVRWCFRGATFNFTSIRPRNVIYIIIPRDSSEMFDWFLGGAPFNLATIIPRDVLFDGFTPSDFFGRSFSRREKNPDCFSFSIVLHAKTNSLQCFVELD